MHGAMLGNAKTTTALLKCHHTGYNVIGITNHPVYKQLYLLCDSQKSNLSPGPVDSDACRLRLIENPYVYFYLFRYCSFFLFQRCFSESHGERDLVD